jgi:hypothetical protein
MPDKVKFSRYFLAYREIFCERRRLAAKTSKILEILCIYTVGYDCRQSTRSPIARVINVISVGALFGISVVTESDGVQLLGQRRSAYATS